MLVVGTDFEWIVAGQDDCIHERVELDGDGTVAVDELMDWMTKYLLKHLENKIFLCFDSNVAYLGSLLMEKIRYSVIATRVFMACETPRWVGGHRPGIYLTKKIKGQLQAIAAEMNLTPMEQPVRDLATLLMVCGTRLLESGVYATLTGC